MCVFQLRREYAVDVLFALVGWAPLLLLRRGIGILSLVPRRARREVADGSIWQVELLERARYGRASVRIVYSIQAHDGSSFYAIRETRTRISQLPQVGQHVTVRFDPTDHHNFEILDTAGSEAYGAQTAQTPRA